MYLDFIHLSVNWTDCRPVRISPTPAKVAYSFDVRFCIAPFAIRATLTDLSDCT
jgi:hypothetical protein